MEIVFNFNERSKTTLKSFIYIYIYIYILLRSINKSNGLQKKHTYYINVVQIEN